MIRYGAAEKLPLLRLITYCEVLTVKNKSGNKNTIVSFPKWLYLLPFVFVIFILPLTVYGHIYNVNSFFLGVSMTQNGKIVDVFLYSKAIILYITAGLCIFLMFCNLIMERKILINDKLLFFGVTSIIMCLFSLSNSKSISVSLWGGEELFQGVVAYFAYFVLFYYTYFIISKTEINSIKLIHILIISLSNVLFVVAILQYINKDPFSNLFIQKICNIKNAQILMDNKVYLTLYHSNYVGVVGVILFPIVLFGEEIYEYIRLKVLSYITTLELIGIIVLSGSKTSIFVLLFMMILLLLDRFLKGKKKSIFIILLCIFSILFLVVAISNSRKMSTISRMTHLFRPIGEWKSTLTGLDTSDEYVKLSFDKGDIFVFWSGDKIMFKDQNNIEIIQEKAESKEIYYLKKLIKKNDIDYKVINEDATKIVATSDGYRIIYSWAEVETNKKPVKGLLFVINGKLWFFTNQIYDEGYYYLSDFGRFEKSVISRDAFPYNYYGFATYRGYIWSKSIPLLKKTMILGISPCHFVIEFPNNDYASKSIINSRNVIINKPHNLYLQMAIETGVVSLIAIMIMIIGYIIRGYKILKMNKIKKKNDNIMHTLIIGYTFSIIGFIMVSFFNDGMIVTLPLFWIIMGIYSGLIFRINNEHQ